MTRGLLTLRSQLGLLERRLAKRVFYDGPLVGTTGLFLSRAFDKELMKLDQHAQRIVWRVPAGSPFTAMYCLDGLVTGSGMASMVAAFREDTGDLAWKRLELAGLVPHNGRLLSMDQGKALVELNPTTGESLRRVPVANEGFAGLTAGAEVVLKPRHPLLDDGNRASELARPYRCLNLESGAVVWERNLAQQAWEAAGQPPHYVTNLVEGSLGESWIGRWQESTFACSRKDGSLTWFARDVECGLRADVKDGRVFGMARGGGWFYVLDERTGAMLSRHDGAGLEGAAYPRPAVFLGEYAIYGMESGHLAVFDPRDARLVWVKRHKAPLSDVRVIDGLVYVTTGKGELLVYEPAA